MNNMVLIIAPSIGSKNAWNEGERQIVWFISENGIRWDL
ncbi:hypothetical protein THERMOS_1643 [Bathymodiolus thermophilus thioautotrophic gill symbiont]|uniref:Uncharacterized protein n=1 Tax=Bathymodiolus thermophilus thioautotrophic gill symbiont TaxID=2360 RepID=A0A8H8XDM2_9GAMM|nr:hypothetical protein THERMOS_1643 [Bathymodiolus thermophilus thioautotrophic gill symbiont]